MCICTWKREKALAWLGWGKEKRNGVNKISLKKRKPFAYLGWEKEKRNGVNKSTEYKEILCFKCKKMTIWKDQSVVIKPSDFLKQKGTLTYLFKASNSHYFNIQVLSLWVKETELRSLVLFGKLVDKGVLGYLGETQWPQEGN